ncbi:hypothetical protein NBRC10512_005917 [Rhodotorula toruloides]|uniref:RHTO0S08e07734g1_1 n=1 Tax=Rhodotorula toruloides TaxID=5286 RepID=A0A061B1V2_RHOTO|nr:RHTO0S08e07734g1_1 [Rhodotorula toruloides]
MLTRVPLDIVLHIVRHAVDREAYDEDWRTYQQRLAQLCLVCKEFRDAVQPVLWRTLRVKWLEHFHQVAGREGRNRHLVKHVEELRGGPEFYGANSRQGDAVPFLRYYLPKLQAISLDSFGARGMALEHLALFDNFRYLSLHYYRLEATPAGLTLPQLETLSLAHCDAQLAAICDLLRPGCTAQLRHLALSHLDITAESGSTPHPPVLDRLRLVQLEGYSDAFAMYQVLPFDQAIFLSFPWSPDSLVVGSPLDLVRRKPDFLQLGKLPAYIFNESNSHATAGIDRHVQYFTHTGALQQAKAMFLPSELADTTLFTQRAERQALLSLLLACQDNATPVVFYHANRDAIGDFTTALLPHVERVHDAAYHEQLLAQMAKLVEDWEDYNAVLSSAPPGPIGSHQGDRSGPLANDLSSSFDSLRTTRQPSMVPPSRRATDYLDLERDISEEEEERIESESSEEEMLVLVTTERDYSYPTLVGGWDDELDRLDD